MSEISDFIDDGNKKIMMELIELLETGHVRNSATENPADSERAENSQPADTNETGIRMYLEDKLSEANGLSRTQLEELVARCLYILANQNKITDALVRKLDERMQDLAALKQNYKHLEIQINNIEKKILSVLEAIQNPVNIQFDRVRRFMAAQANRDAPVTIIGLTMVDESTSADKATSTAGSEPVSNEEPALDDEETAQAAKEPLSPKESQSVEQQIINTLSLPGLPIIFATEPSNKPMAPAPQIKIHLLNNQIALTWSMLEEDVSAYEQMLTYQVYCCKETNEPPTPANWWKLIELTARPLPMSCVVDRCTAGKFYFAVRGIDVQMRVGPFSLPVPVIFDVRSIKPFA